MLVATIIGFLTVFQVRTNAGGLGLNPWTTWVVGFALAAALALTLVVGPVLDRFHVPVVETWGILALHILAVASFASVMTVLVGRWAILPVWLFFVVLGNSACGGAVSPPLLPGPVRVHLAVAAIRRDGHLASRRDLFPRLPARTPDPGPRGVGGDALRRDAARVAAPPDEPGRCDRAERARWGLSGTANGGWPR